MPTLDEYFQSEGESFDSYHRWLQEALPEELVAGGVRPGMLIQLELECKLGRYEFYSDQFDKLHQFLLEQGFTLNYHQETSHLNVYGLSEKFYFLVNYHPQKTSMVIGSENLPEGDQEIAPDLSKILQNLIHYVQRERISAILKPDDGKYEIKSD